jgi:hypothetical protein
LAGGRGVGFFVNAFSFLALIIALISLLKRPKGTGRGGTTA